MPLEEREDTGGWPASADNGSDRTEWLVDRYRGGCSEGYRSARSKYFYNLAYYREESGDLPRIPLTIFRE